jgi:hypothetical protein
LAAYLYLDAATTASMFFAAARRTTRKAPAEVVAVRSFGLCQIDGSQDDVLTAAVEVICSGVCQRWRGAAELAEPSATSELPEFHIAHQKNRTTTTEVDNEEVERFGQEMATGLELSLDPLTARVNSLIDQFLGSDSATYFQQLLAPLFPVTAKMAPHEFRPTRVEESLTKIDSLLGPASSEATPAATNESHSSLHQLLTARIDALAEERARVLRESVLGLLDRSKSRAAGSVALAEWYAARLQQLETSVRDLAQQVAAELARVEQQLPGRQAAVPGKPKPKPAPVDEPKLTNEWRERLLHYARLRTGAMVARGAARFTQALRTEAGAVEHAVKTLKRDLAHLEAEFRVAGWSAVVNDSTSDNVKATIVSAFRARLGELAMKVERATSQDLLAGESTLRMAAEKRLDFQAGFADKLRGLAKSSLNVVMRDIDLSAAMLQGHEAPAGDAQNGQEKADGRLSALLAAARPKLMAAGGEQRMLLVLPEGSSETSLRESIGAQFGQQPNVVFDSDRDAAICYESQGLPLARVAAAIIDHRPEYAQAAQRLHTRTDVEWTPMD